MASVALEEKFGLLSLLTEMLNHKLPALATVETVQKQVSALGGQISTVSPAENLATLILTGIAFFGLFIVTALLLRIIFNLLNQVFDHGVLGFVNRMAGVLLELSKYAIIVLIVVMVLNPLLQTAAGMGFSGAQTAVESIHQSYLIAKMLDIVGMI
jgi:hypothetical protein